MTIKWWRYDEDTKNDDDDDNINDEDDDNDAWEGPITMMNQI